MFVPPALLRVSQSASSEVVQVVLLAMEKLVEPAVLPTGWLAGSTVR